MSDSYHNLTTACLLGLCMGVLLMYSTNGKKTGEKDQDQAVPACPPNIYRLVLNHHSVDMDNTQSILHSNLVERGFNVIKVPNCMSLLQENMHMNIPLTLHTQADNHDREIQYSIAQPSNIRISQGYPNH